MGLAGAIYGKGSKTKTIAWVEFQEQPPARRQQKVLYYLHYNILLMNPQPTANNTQNQNGPLPPYPPVASPSLSMSRAAAPTTHGAAAPYGLMQGARHWFRRRRC
jgi:hypothetical protein